MIVVKLALLLAFVSCAGYKLDTKGNPLARHGVHSLAVAQFVNYSNVPEVAEKLTREFMILFSEYDSLKVVAGEDSGADATLVGVVDGPRRVRDTVSVSQTQVTGSGDRRDFFVPITAGFTLNVHISVVKNGDGSTVVDEKLPLVGSYNIITAESSTNDSLGLVNFTKNRALMGQSVSRAVEEFAQNFEDVVLSAF